LPIDVDKDHEAVLVFGPKEISVLFKSIAQLAVHTSANGDLMSVHEIDEGVELFARVSSAKEEVGVDIDDRKLGSRWGDSVGLEHRTRPKTAQQQIASISSIELRRRRLSVVNYAFPIGLRQGRAVGGSEEDG